MNLDARVIFKGDIVFKLVFRLKPNIYVDVIGNFLFLIFVRSSLESLMDNVLLINLKSS
jgi:hypothetical protein